MDPLSLFASVLFGCIGLAACQIGRRRESARLMAVGVALIGFTYLTPAGLWTWAVGAGLVALLFVGG